MTRQPVFIINNFMSLLAVCVLLSGCQTATRQSAASRPAQLPVASAKATTTATAESPLGALQSAFRPSYNQARDEVGAALAPLVVVRFSDLYLVKDGKVIAEGKGIPQKYHLLHRTAHVPFVIFLKLRPHFGSPLKANIAADLRAYGALIDAAIPDLGNYGFTAEEIAWQQKILRESQEFLKSAVEGARVSRESFAAYEKRTHRAMTALADVAGAAQVDATHAVMTDWRRKLTADEWKQLRVIIVGFRQPRHDYAATQYFAAIFPEKGNSLFPGENRRVFYVENLNIDRNDRSFEDQRRAVAALVLDTEASEIFFNDPYRMSIDVMADGARRRVSELDLSPMR